MSAEPIDVGRFRCGDTVYHVPTGETWMVAYADYRFGWMAWSGWPEGQAKISDCTIVSRATDEEHRKEVLAWSEVNNDHRAVQVRDLYPDALVQK